MNGTPARSAARAAWTSARAAIMPPSPTGARITGIFSCWPSTSTACSRTLTLRLLALVADRAALPAHVGGRVAHVLGHADEVGPDGVQLLEDPQVLAERLRQVRRVPRNVIDERVDELERAVPVPGHAGLNP